MRITWTYTLCAVLLSAACADFAGPEIPDNSGSAHADLARLEVVQTDGADHPTLSVEGLSNTVVAYDPSAPKLEMYRATFTATQGEDTVFRLHYEDGTGSEAPFMTVLVPHDAQMLDRQGRPLPPGTSVDVTVDVDRNQFSVRMDADGVTMKEGDPFTVIINMSHARLGARLSSDVSAWQASASLGWGIVPTGTSATEGHLEFKTELFSNYAVAW